MDKPMVYIKQLTPDQRGKLTEAIAGLAGNAAGQPEVGFVGALGMSMQAAAPLLAELERAGFLVRHDGRLHAGTKAGSGTVKFSHAARRRQELLTKSPIGKRVLAEQGKA